MSSKVPPQALEAEEAVLGGALLDNQSFNSLISIIGPSDFYTKAHQTIYAAMSELHQENKVVDLLTLTDQLRKNSQLEAVGGAAYLARLADAVPTAANILDHARIVREKSTLRDVIRVSTEIVENAYQENDDVGGFLDAAEKKIFDIRESRTPSSLKPISEIVQDSFKAIEKMYGSESAITGVPTGYHEIDRITSGLQLADLIIVAGRPSMGKTAFCLNIAQNVSVKYRIPTAIFSLEMSQQSLAMRMLCSEARVDSSKLRGGGLNEDDWMRLTHSAGELSEAPIYIDDTAQMSPLEMRAKARRLKSMHGLGLIIVDYLQLMRGNGKIESREREISDISRSLKAMAKDLNCPVIALSQLNRAVEMRQQKQPVLADLRESGAIEQDADLIAFIYRDEVYNEETADKGVAEIIISKHRNGPVGTARLAFLSEYTRFENLEYRY